MRLPQLHYQYMLTKVLCYVYVITYLTTDVSQFRVFHAVPKLRRILSRTRKQSHFTRRRSFMKIFNFVEHHFCVFGSCD